VNDKLLAAIIGLVGALCGGTLTVAGGLLGVLVAHYLETRREKRQRDERLLTGARQRMFNDRALPAEIAAWMEDARRRRVPVDMNEANLEGAELQGLPLSGANLRMAKLNEANLHGATLSKANLCGAKLRGADLTEADLRDADLSGAALDRADARGANFSGANLTDAILDRANLEGAQVSDEQLSMAALLQGTILPDGTKHD